MQAFAGVTRSAGGLDELANLLAGDEGAVPDAGATPDTWERANPDTWERANMVLIGRAVAAELEDRVVRDDQRHLTAHGAMRFPS